VLHLATHTYLLPEPSTPAGFALAGANTWISGGQPPPLAGNGLLSADEVLEMDLVGTDLVVLSACATGAGRPVAGEGLFGLRRSFLIAGARSVLVAAWPIRDRATATFMRAFYASLLAGETKAEALAAARTTVRATRPDVRFWGPFTLIGDVGPLLSFRHPRRPGEEPRDTVTPPSTSTPPRPRPTARPASG